jgi:hypothetical protein
MMMRRLSEDVLLRLGDLWLPDRDLVALASTCRSLAALLRHRCARREGWWLPDPSGPIVSVHWERAVAPPSTARW